MKRFLPLIPAILLTLGLDALHAAPKPSSIKPSNSSLGVSTSLTTAGFQFYLPAISPSANLIRPEAFAASFVVTNRTKRPIVFTRPGPATPVRPSLVPLPRIVFEVYNDEGTVVWQSWIAPAGAAEIEVSLAPGAAWRSTVRVPLKIEGVNLPEGTYKLRASVIGTPEISATTSFAVGHVTISTSR